MSGPRVVQSEGLGETAAKALGGLADTMQHVFEMRRQQQQDALRTLLTQTQMQEAQASTERSQTATAAERQQMRDRQRATDEANRISLQTQRDMGPLVLQIAAGKRPGDPEYDNAVSQMFADESDPAVTAALQKQTTGFADAFRAGSAAQESAVNAGVAKAKAPVERALAQAQQQLFGSDPAQLRFAAMHQAGTLPVYLENLRASHARQTERTAANTQGAMLRRQLVIDALNNAVTQYQYEDPSSRPPLPQYMTQFLGAYANSITDPVTGKPMDATVLSREAGRLIRNIPDAPTLTGNRTRDTAALRTYYSQLRRAGFDDAAARAYMANPNGVPAPSTP